MCITTTTNAATDRAKSSNVCLVDASDKHHRTNGNVMDSPKKTEPLEPGRNRKLRKSAECVLGLSLPLWVTINIQENEPSCRISSLIASTMAVYGILYALLRHFNTFLQPPLSSWLVTNNKGSPLASAAEWRSRLLATINALILIVGSGLCFSEWVSTYVPASEGWVKTLPFQCESGSEDSDEDDVCSCFLSHPVTFASLFVGYLQWDLCWLIWHRDTHPDFGSMIHHSIFIGVTQFVLSETYFRKPFAWLSFTELSTPFLHVRWILAATDQKSGSLYFWVSLGFALTFLTTRAIGYGLGLIDVWWNQASWGTVTGLWGVVAGLHLAYLLNLFWSFKVGSALLRTLSKSDGNAKGKKAQ